MSKDRFNAVFTPEVLASLFPVEKADDFFEALFGDAGDGAYDIELAYNAYDRGNLQFELRMIQRPGKCLGCHLTYGLPEVFSRHPVIDIKGLVGEIGKRLDGHGRVGEWRLGATRELSRELHVIPLSISLVD
ncbi:MAG: pancreas/duodenum homeobox protein 1 [Pseudomonadota bacterium]